MSEGGSHATPSPLSFPPPDLLPGPRGEPAAQSSEQASGRDQEPLRRALQATGSQPRRLHHTRRVAARRSQLPYRRPQRRRPSEPRRAPAAEHPARPAGAVPAPLAGAPLPGSPEPEPAEPPDPALRESLEP